MDILGFALAILLIELTPGPNMAWLAGLAATEGRQSGLRAVAGVALGLLANGLLAAFGLAAILESAPYLWNVLRLAGAAMMAYLAFDAWRGAETGAGRAHPRYLGRRAFVSGALMNLLNPKAYIFFLVVVPQFLRGAKLDIPAIVILSLVSTSIATVIHLAIVTAGSAAHGWLSDPDRTRIVRRLFAVITLGVGISFLLIDLG